MEVGEGSTVVVGSWHHHRFKGKVENCCNCLRKLVDAENLLEKQGSAPGAQEALVLAVASVVGARGA
jgi:hypothetical protein